jgi:hypothetical protein
MESAVISALAASPVKEVSCAGGDLWRLQFLEFRALTSLRLWRIDEASEGALPEIVQYSPGLRVLNLEFYERPSLCFFPALFRHTPALEELVVTLCRDGGESDLFNDGCSEGEALQSYVEDSAQAVLAFAHLLCPYLNKVRIQIL